MAEVAAYPSASRRVGRAVRDFAETRREGRAAEGGGPGVATARGGGRGVTCESERAAPKSRERPKSANPRADEMFFTPLDDQQSL